LIDRNNTPHSQPPLLLYGWISLSLMAHQDKKCLRLICSLFISSPIASFLSRPLPTYSFRLPFSFPSSNSAFDTMN
jgi:hypothetical protein